MMFKPLLAVTAAALLASAASHAEDPAGTAAATVAPPPVTAKKSAKASKPGAATQAAAHDRLELDATSVTGSRELPKVLVIVPWKKADLGDLAGKPLNSLVDDALQPLDREVFRREIDYHSALAPDHAKAAPVAVRSPEGGGTR
jgi:hypothetical protein